MDSAADVKRKIADLKARWPAHSVPPAMWMELEDLEEQLKNLSAAETIAVSRE
jgi:hypothetical protein